MQKAILHCYLVAGSQDCRHLPEYQISPQYALLTRLEHALKAGITCYQFREKERFSLQDPQKIAELGRECQLLCQQYNVPFIVNNDLELALKLRADGIHIGQTDYTVEDVAKQVGGKMLIGLSINQVDQAVKYNQFTDVSYYGCGPIFPTQSKSDAALAVGMTFIRELRLQGITKPIVAIGGITPDKVVNLYQMGTDGIAIISAIMRAENIQSTVKQILQGAE